jgi:hypothetical protein
MPWRSGWGDNILPSRLAVEMEAAALYALAEARRKPWYRQDQGAGEL